MKRLLAFSCFAVLARVDRSSFAQVSEKVIDIPTRSGVTPRFAYSAPQRPKAAVIPFAGGHGGLQT